MGIPTIILAFGPKFGKLIILLSVVCDFLGELRKCYFKHITKFSVIHTVSVM